MAPILSMLLLVSLSGPTNHEFSNDLPLGPHTSQAVKEVETTLSRRTHHHIRAFMALGNDITKRIDFVEHVNEVLEMLDAIRSSDTAQSLLENIPGSEWIQMGLDKLSGVVRTIDEIRDHLTEMQTTSNELSNKLTNHLAHNKGDPVALQKLLREMEEANPVYRRAARAFKDTEDLMRSAEGVLKQTANTIGKAADVPLVGRAARPIRDKLQQISVAIQVARAILKSGRNAIERYDTECQTLQHQLGNGLAQDTYNAGELNLEQHRHGTALIRYYQVRVNWPDSTWSHRADRRIVDTMAVLDRMSLEKKQLGQRVAHLEASVTGLGEQLEQKKQEHGEIQSRLSSKEHQLLWMSIAMLGLIIIGSVIWILGRRRRNESLEFPPEST